MICDRKLILSNQAIQAQIKIHIYHGGFKIDKFSKLFQFQKVSKRLEG